MARVVVAGGGHDDRHRADRAQHPQQLDAVEVGQARGRARPGPGRSSMTRCSPAMPVGCGRDGVPALGQRADQRRADRGVVLDEQQHGHGADGSGVGPSGRSGHARAQLLGLPLSAALSGRPGDGSRVDRPTSSPGRPVGGLRRGLGRCGFRGGRPGGRPVHRRRTTRRARFAGPAGDTFTDPGGAAPQPDRAAQRRRQGSRRARARDRRSSPARRPDADVGRRRSVARPRSAASPPGAATSPAPAGTGWSRSAPRRRSAGRSTTSTGPGRDRPGCASSPRRTATASGSRYRNGAACDRQ